MSLAIAVSPGGHLFVEPDDQAEPKVSQAIAAGLVKAFEHSTASGLERLASDLLHEPLPPTFVFWRGLAQRLFTALCHNPEQASGSGVSIPAPAESELAALVEAAPPMKGLEYLNPEVLARLWAELAFHVQTAIARTPGGASAWLRERNPVWNAVGRVTFHLVENKRNPAYPFAFLATYTHGISGQGRVQHLPLGRALEEYAGAKNRAALANLLSPVQRAGQQSELARRMLESRAIFHPQLWRPDEAFQFLQNVPQFEQSGLVVRIPDWWRGGRPPRPKVNVKIGEAKGKLDRSSLLDFRVDVSLEGEPLTASEVRSILQSASGLVLLKGKWVEVDRDKLQQVLDHWNKVHSTMRPDGVTLLEAMRLLSGFDLGPAVEPELESARADWSSIAAGDALRKVLEQIQHPDASSESDPGPELHATLRPYQQQGAHWLWFMNQLGLGACLADDMGLGKTIQVLSLLLVLKRAKAGRDGNSADHTPALLVVPASLIANWRAEIQKFAPSLSVFYLHPSENPKDELAAVGEAPAESLGGRELVITSYSMAIRLGWLKQLHWPLVVLDEAQAIRNAGTRQSRLVRELPARHRIALTGTPIENRLSDLWSLFDFICPGLLGGAKEFAALVKGRSQLDGTQFAPLRRLVRPYILRRLKTDKRIIGDLPDKTEMTAFCALTRRQAVLYAQAVTELAERLDAPEVEGIQRRGIILAFLTRFKQVCNHPSQWLGDGEYKAEDSGKFRRLAELSEEIAARQEKALVFTQYREMTEPLARHLANLFGREGLVMHGGTPVGRRKQLVDSFQQEEGPPFFVLSLKAGGTGLNLTAASHVIHFDRWWNPAVENQATDRAFRIGQKKNVLVHKFTCRGTLEEKIHELIVSKSALAEDVLGEGGERLLTEMSNTELLRFVALDVHATVEE